ncbi:hypothetical protein MUP05_03800 [Candidatus Bathyarchaeota archaeon]|nr:hypothetical protein [Candidatus Bathyarchaeota archaeon]
MTTRPIAGAHTSGAEVYVETTVRTLGLVSVTTTMTGERKVATRALVKVEIAAPSGGRAVM